MGADAVAGGVDLHAVVVVLLGAGAAADLDGRERDAGQHGQANVSVDVVEMGDVVVAAVWVAVHDLVARVNEQALDEGGRRQVALGVRQRRAGGAGGTRGAQQQQQVEEEEVTA